MLEKIKIVLEKHPVYERRDMFTSSPYGTTEKPYSGLLQGVNESLEFEKMDFKMFSEQENILLQQRFAYRFLSQIAFLKQIAKIKNYKGNAKLRKFAEKLLNVKMKQEITPIKEAIMIFNGE